LILAIRLFNISISSVMFEQKEHFWYNISWRKYCIRYRICNF